MSQAYQQLVLEEGSRNLVVINTHRGLFRYTRLPFGVSSAPGIFQRAMENLLRGIRGVVVYIDDILITGVTNEEHKMALEEVLQRLETANLRLKKSKCRFMQDSVTFLGHKIDAKGIHPLPEKVRAICEAPTPKTVSELKAYLGLLTYYSRFLPNMATTLEPLYALLRSDNQWKWAEEQQEAFEASKKLLTSSKVLAHFNPDLELVLACDASPMGIGAVLSHKMPGGEERPIGFTSRTLTAAERGYSQIEKEGLACIFGVKRFHLYIYGRHFELQTDHKPLLSLFNESKAVSPQASGRIQRWALTLASYDYTITFRSTTQHCNADALSWLPLPETRKTTPVPQEVVLMIEGLRDSPISAAQVKSWTRRDPVLSQVYQYTLQGWPAEVEENLKLYWTRKSELSIHDGWGNRIVVPLQGREMALKELHGGHPGVTRMKALARMFLWWPGIDKAIEYAVKHCSECQKNRPSPPVSPMQPWQWPTRPWARITQDHSWVACFWS